MSKLAIYLIDIETSPNLGWTWGKYEQNVLRFDKQWELMSFAYKRLGGKRVRCLARPHYDDKTEKKLVSAVWDVFNEADVLIGHNIDDFDNRKMKAKFVEHGFLPPKPYKTVDTKKIAKSQFAFNSNSLDDLGRTLKLGCKKQTGGIDLWFDCMDGNRAAWAKMIEYNKQDVVLLERIYEKLKAWYPTHPNLALLDNMPGCPVCSSLHVQRRGFSVARLRRAPRFACQECGHWFSGETEAMKRRLV